MGTNLELAIGFLSPVVVKVTESLAVPGSCHGEHEDDPRVAVPGQPEGALAESSLVEPDPSALCGALATCWEA